MNDHTLHKQSHLEIRSLAKSLGLHAKECDECLGTGHAHQAEWIKCGECVGAGVVFKVT